MKALLLLTLLFLSCGKESLPFNLSAGIENGQLNISYLSEVQGYTIYISDSKDYEDAPQVFSSTTSTGCCCLSTSWYYQTTFVTLETEEYLHQIIIKE